ncbi:MAG: ABC transporter permease [Trueperaceae bacterium]
MNRAALRPTVVAAALAVIRANLLRLSRDRVGLAFIVAIPFLLISVIGATTPDAGAARPIGWTVAAPSDRSAELAAVLDAEPALNVTRNEAEEVLRAAVRRGQVAAGLVVGNAAGAAESAAEGAATGDATAAADGDAEPLRVAFVTDPSRPPDAALRATVHQAVRTAALERRTASFVADATGLTLDEARSAADAMPLFGSTASETTTIGGEGAPATSGMAFVAPAYLVLFLFINTLVAAWGLPADRASGLARRTRATPAWAASLAAGEAGYRFLVALLQAALIIVVGAAAFGVAWGDPLAVMAIVTLFAWVATVFAMLLGSLVRTPEQATSLAPPIGIAAGMLGGCMWPLEAAAPALQVVGQATPHAWAVSAFQQVVGAGAGVAQIAPQLGVLAMFALGASVAAWAAFRSRSV